jgi:Condensation domain
MDGWSLAAMLAELFQDYSNLIQGTERPAPPPTLRYRDYVALEKQAGQSDAARTFWTNKLEHEAISVLHSYGGDVAKAAAHLKWPEAKMHAAVAYTQAFPDEIEEAIRDNESFDFEKLSRLLPGIGRCEGASKSKK